jgi:hypothetical protein
VYYEKAQSLILFKNDLVTSCEKQLHLMKTTYFGVGIVSMRVDFVLRSAEICPYIRLMCFFLAANLPGAI